MNQREYISTVKLLSSRLRQALQDPVVIFINIKILSSPSPSLPNAETSWPPVTMDWKIYSEWRLRLVSACSSLITSPHFKSWSWCDQKYSMSLRFRGLPTWWSRESCSHHPWGIRWLIGSRYLEGTSHDESASCMKDRILEREGVGLDSYCRSIIDLGWVDEVIDLFFAVVWNVG